MAGFCMAAATWADNLGAVVWLVAFAGLFACISFELPSRAVAWMKRADRDTDTAPQAA